LNEPKSLDPLNATLPPEIKAMIRVNQAGEYGAIRIYAGQLAVLSKSSIAPTLKEMEAQEQEHLRTFNEICVEKDVPPTIFQPLWHVGGYLLGAATALLGEKAAHACTIAVEEVIADHYQDQLNRLEISYGNQYPQLREVITKFREEELEHKDHAEQEGGREAQGYEIITGVVKTISKAAIWLSTRR
jgi:ubiquinone biosynthesis monooxygenase Coq7